MFDCWRAGTSQRDPEHVPPAEQPHGPAVSRALSSALQLHSGGRANHLRSQMLGGGCSGRPAASGRLGGPVACPQHNGPLDGLKTAPNDKRTAMAGCAGGTCVEPATLQGMPACVLLPPTLHPSPFAQSHRITHGGCCLAVLLVKVKLERMRAV